MYIGTWTPILRIPSVYRTLMHNRRLLVMSLLAAECQGPPRRSLVRRLPTAWVIVILQPDTDPAAVLRDMTGLSYSSYS
jgi:hypothetical protein